MKRQETKDYTEEKKGRETHYKSYWKNTVSPPNDIDQQKSTAILCCEDEEEDYLSWTDMPGLWAGPLIEIKHLHYTTLVVQSISNSSLLFLPNRLFLKITSRLFLSNCTLIFCYDEKWDFMLGPY